MEYEHFMGRQILSGGFLKYEITFSLRCKTLNERYKGLKDTWHHGVLYVEYERLKKIKEEEHQQ